MYQLSRTFVAKVLNFLLVVSLVVSLLGIVYDLKNSLKTGGIDLRNRVVGARLLSQGMDPYYYRWQEGDPETLLDPLDKLELPVSRVTIPPTGLIPYVLTAKLPYIYQRVIWLCLQWGAVLLSLLLLLKRGADPLRNRFLLGYGLLFIAGSPFWRLHTTVGQLYVFYVLLMAAAYWVSSKRFRFSDEAAGLLIGLAASTRFPILVMILPMLLFKKFRLLAATLGGFALCVGGSIAIFGSQVWGSYFSAMHTISQLSQGIIPVSKATQNRVVFKIVEGMVFKSSIDTNELPLSNSSIPFLLEHHLDIELPSSYLIIGLMVSLLAYLFILHHCYQKIERQSRLPVLDMLFISGSLMLIMSELLMPIPRYNYSDIQLLVPILLLLKNANFYHTSTVCLFLLLSVGLLLLGGLFPWLPHEILLGQFLVVAVLLLLSLKLKTEVSKPAELPAPRVPVQR